MWRDREIEQKKLHMVFTDLGKTRDRVSITIDLRQEPH